MRNVFFIFKLFLLLFFVNSCSNDEQIEANKIDKTVLSDVSDFQRTTSEIRSEYLVLLGEQEYKDFDNKVILFVSKFPESEERVNFQSKADLLDWINLNIGTTQFSSSAEAASEFDEITSLYTIFYNKNINFFTEIRELSIADRSHIYMLGIDNSFDGDEYVERVGAVSVGPCVWGCINSAVECSNDVNAQYANSMNMGDIMMQNGNILGGLAAYAMAKVTQRLGQQNCATAFNNCVNNCGSN
jgi:hypothetical protein